MNDDIFLMRIRKHLMKSPTSSPELITREINKITTNDALNTALIYACEYHNATIVKYLINHDARADAEFDNKTPLFYTVDVTYNYFEKSPEYKLNVINYIVDLLLKTDNAIPEHMINNKDKSVLLRATSIFWLESTAIKIWIYLVDHNLQSNLSNQTQIQVEQNAARNKMHDFLWYFHNYNKTDSVLYAAQKKGFHLDPESVEMLHSYLHH